ncbi:hypothetical protein OOK31_36755 [Streptomyces sp. NBC_00249]|nr:hypothetical protein [Streptomyces sp. NBC_00249]
MRRYRDALFMAVGRPVPQSPRELLQAMCAHITACSGREVRLMFEPMPAGTISGLWIDMGDFDLIVVEADTSPLHQVVIAGHELWHHKERHCGRHGGPAGVAAAPRMLADRWRTGGAAAHVAARGDAGLDEERRAEAFGRLLGAGFRRGSGGSADMSVGRGPLRTGLLVLALRPLWRLVCHPVTGAGDALLLPTPWYATPEQRLMSRITSAYDWILKLRAYYNDDVRAAAYRQAKQNGEPERDAVVSGLAVMLRAAAEDRAREAPAGDEQSTRAALAFRSAEAMYPDLIVRISRALPSVPAVPEDGVGVDNSRRDGARWNFEGSRHGRRPPGAEVSVLRHHHDREQTARLARSAVADLAPEELELFEQTAEAFFARPVPRRAVTVQDPVGMGLETVVGVLSGVALAVTTSVLQHVAVQTADRTRNMFRFRRRREAVQSVPDPDPEPVSGAQLGKLRELAQKRGMELGLSAERAELLADALVGGLTRSAQDGGGDRDGGHGTRPAGAADPGTGG